MPDVSHPNPLAPDPPARIRAYPPLGGLIGVIFLTWLFGSLALGCFRGPVKDGFLGTLFALPALLFFFLSWTFLMEVLFMRRTGIFLGLPGIRFVEAGLFGLQTKALAWPDVAAVTLEKTTLKVSAREPAASLVVKLDDFLEEPDWVADRARALWQRASAQPVDLPEERIGALQAELDTASCTRCGGSVDVPLDGAPVRCGYCGSVQSLSPRVGQALNRLVGLLAQLPTAHRQVRDRLVLKWVEKGGQRSRNLVCLGWGTAVLWLVFAGVSLAAESAKRGRLGADTPFLVLTLAMALFSVLAGHLLAAFSRRLARAWAVPNLAVEPAAPGGAARCRTCGADLPATGLVRRCEYCGTDSLVTGARLAAVERSAKRLLVVARRQATQTTQGAIRLLGRVAGVLEGFAWTQFLWLHVPIIVALEGYPGMVLRLSTVCAAVAAGAIAAGFVGLRWLREGQAPREDGESAGRRVAPR